MSKVTLAEVSKFANDDFQGRFENGGNGPGLREGIPDTIEAYEEDSVALRFTFKNTDESEATNWVIDFANKEGIDFSEVIVEQTGAYENDWVDVIGFVDSVAK